MRNTFQSLHAVAKLAATDQNHYHRVLVLFDGAFLPTMQENKWVKQLQMVFGDIGMVAYGAAQTSFYGQYFSYHFTTANGSPILNFRVDVHCKNTIIPPSGILKF